MSTQKYLPLFFITGVILTMVGGFLKIIRLPGLDPFLIFGMILMLVFVILAVWEVNTSARINRSEKLMWTLGLIFMGGIVGIVYLLSARKRIIASNTKNAAFR